MAGFSALVDFSDPHQPDGPRLRHAFANARRVLTTHEPAQVLVLLKELQQAAEQGQWCVGYLRYEAAPAFDAALAVHPADGPLAWFAIFDEALPWPQDLAASDAVHASWPDMPARPWFDASIKTLLQAIADGELYQANLTAQMAGLLQGAAGTDLPLALFSALQRAQPGGYAAYLDTGGEQLLSVSPELFFDWQDSRLLTRPMKGTAARGINPQDDAAQAEALRTSAKERAENVMIVDLLRNDVSRIAQPFSVKVPRLFHAQALPSVWQMTSDVEARTRKDCGLADVFAALFPCGSVTGAPKVRAMQMIRALEPQPRGVYCGAMGVVRPGGAATFNVPIRTVSVRGQALRCGIGSAITADARAEGEWQEWQHKQVFVLRASQPFELLETLLLQDGQLRNAGDHMARMAASAMHFAYPWPAQAVADGLQQLQQQHAQGTWRVRILLDAQGRVQVEAHAMPASPQRVVLKLAERPLAEAHGEFVRHKTTRRAHYDAFSPTQPGVFDTLLWNEEGEITECTRGNVALLLAGRWVTPALHCGLLGGIGRAQAISQGRVEEAVVRVGQLAQVRGWAFLNSLRGWIEAELLP